MLLSMTGYGKASCKLNNKFITVEASSLNSKYLDLNLIFPQNYKEKEIELRSEVARQLERGRIELKILIENNRGEQRSIINEKLAKSYYKELKKITKELKINHADYLKTLIQLPDVLQKKELQINEKEWIKISETTNKALKQVIIFRQKEGRNLQKDIQENINKIKKSIINIEKIEPNRISSIKNRISNNLKELIGLEKINEDRYEQELIYYLEKLDISEEKVRLNSHCDYFTEVLNEKQSGGKKLSFIAQEIGREINTIGSKANDAVVQRIIVLMKESLEKIKEQTLNIL